MITKLAVGKPKLISLNEENNKPIIKSLVALAHSFKQGTNNVNEIWKINIKGYH